MTDTAIYWPQEVFEDLDRNGPIPLYFQVSTRLEAAIHDGVIPAGGRLENEVTIGQRLGMSRPTVRRAIQELVDKGLLVRRRGIGTQVVQGHVTRGVEPTSLFEDLRATAHTPTTRLITRATVEADSAVAEALGVPVGEEVLFLRRQRSTDGIPVAVLENYLPREFADITDDQLEQRGLYEILRARGVAIRIAKQKIGARRAQRDEGELLDIDRSGPVLTVERVAYDRSGRAFEFGHHCYRPDMYSFETTLVAR